MYKDNEDYGLNDDNEIYSKSNRDISSKSYDDISSDSGRYDDLDDIDFTHKRQYYNLDEIKRNPRSSDYESRQATPRRQADYYDNYNHRGEYGKTPAGASQPQRSASHSSVSSRTQPAKRKKRKKHILLKFVSVILCLCIAAGVGLYAYTYSLLNKISRVPLDENDLGITTSDFEGYKNIALLGLDTREDDKTGRSDANVILTIDKTHKKIKLTSIARDSYVKIEGHSHDKLTHAYAYGKSQLSVKTLNQNFDLEITDYVTMNFFELAHIIDYIGGIEIELTEKEVPELNRVVGETDFGDMEKPMAQGPGLQRLSGTQAVCFARIRKIDGDIERGNRQKEVLSAMFKEVKKMNPLKLPELASLVVEECETSLETNDIISLGLWAILTSPEFEQLSIPNDNVVGNGKIVKGVWYYYYDIDKAKQEIKDFIFEENYYSPENKAQREAESQEAE